MSQTTDETIKLIKASHEKPYGFNPLTKSFTQGTGGSAATGLTAFDLQAPAKRLFPVATPLRNRLPRVKGRGDIATRWKTITTINPTLVEAGVSESNRGAKITDTVNDAFVPYSFLGLENDVSFEADYAAEGFDDARARASQSVLVSLMEREEKMLLGGNNSVALGTPTGLTLTAPVGVSTLGSTTQSVIVVALTLDGFRRSAVATGIPQQISQVSAGPYSHTDSFGGGASHKSTNSTQAVTNSTTLNATVTAITGAWAYAWFWGLAGSELLGAITTVNKIVITAAATGSQTAASIGATDFSKNALVFDGITSIVANNSTSAYVKSLDGATLTSDGAGRIVEIETALQYFFDNFRLGPNVVWVSSQEMKSISKLVMANGGTPLYRFNADAATGRMNLEAGFIIVNYTNQFMNESIEIRVHPHQAAGTIIFELTQLPPQYYQYSNQGSPLEVHYRRDYYQVDWPVIRRAYEMGVYADETLACYVPFGFGIISNISPS